MTRRFNSFEEIDEQLKILALKREIDKECAKLRVLDIKNHLYPVNLVRSMDGTIARVMIPLVISRIMKKIQSRKKQEV